ncbi:MAG: hypothetical protein IPJ77_20900 [Planctomycetes bacterium]|nr:hypothetical protein [Planctomycetota bacterium]
MIPHERPSESELERALRAGARAHLERASRGRGASLRARVLARLDEPERVSVARRPARWAIAAAVLVVLGGALLLLATRPHVEREHVASRPYADALETSSPRSTARAWSRALATSGDAEGALRLEADALQQDSRELLRRLLACVRVGPADAGS